ncbi:MAG: amidase [Gammaproteobacteria bacterium]|nr:amidase [Gammaproteobacteria bacterium]MBU0785496.1 amidase [Gammaproteobacteria bacterium]MBU0813696.1 amidase [Gammaproteobacteria bacterium]MBU1788832.1 amidase [Gammaproteobacteria bacterium]
MPATDLADLSASELLAMYRSGQASPVEVTRAVLARIERLNPSLNAFCLVAGDEALAAARQSEARWQRGQPCGALDGVPASIKDLILTKGWPTLRGSRTVDATQPWDVDAPATARLREAGAVLLGKTCTPEFGCKGETNSLLTGLTRNPWNTSKTPGGSSGGTAAAVAAGMGPLSVGTDGAGSVRIPAAFCGNFGLKPSFGRVPAYPLSPFGTVAHLGPHTMSVRDAALMMNVLAQPDARDWGSLPYDARDYTLGLDEGIAGLRIAWSPTLGYAKNVHPEVSAACARAVQVLADLGAQVEEVDPGFEDPLDITTGLWFLGAWTVWNTLTPEQQAMTDPDFAAQAELGSRLSALEVQRLHLRRGALGSHMRQFMQRHDLLVTPSVAIPAFDVRPAGQAEMTPEAMLGWTPFSYPFNLTQQPACTIPCGLTADGLPIGLQFVGPMFGDALVLRAARAYEGVHPIARPMLR